MFTPDTDQANALVAQAAGLVGAERLLNVVELSDLLQRQVQITHVRLKPGHSLVVSFCDEKQVHGWAGLTTDPDKLAKAKLRAAEASEALCVHHHQQPYLFSGSIWTDPQLSKELADVREALGGDPAWRLLRYNPRRRVVALVGPDAANGFSRQKVVRVYPGRAKRLVRTANRWRKLGLPVSGMRLFGNRNSATLAPLWGIGDLARTPYAPAAESAGAAIAQLHVATEHDDMPGDHACAPPATMVRSQLESIHAAAGALSQIAPWAEDRLRTLTRSLAAGLQKLPVTVRSEIHGDLSPDQVLVADESSHKIRVIDLDRTGTGAPMADVGSWVAACRRADQLQLGESFLRGYGTHCQVDDPAVGVWEAYAHLTSAGDAFRHQAPDWPQRIVTALDLTEQALTS